MKNHSRSMKGYLFSMMLVTAVGCGGSDGNTPSGSATLKGRVSDSSGSQPQGLSGGTLGGSGSASAAAKVRVGRLKADGGLDVLVEGQVRVDGRYEVAVPAGERRLIAESLDASGKVLAAAIVESSGSAGESVAVTPMDTESSVEAAVLAQMAASGVALAELNAVDLRARINLKVAEAVKASADIDVKVKALAEAVAAAQVAKVKAYASVGINTTQSALFEAELAAAKKLSAALDASASASATVSEQAYASFYADLDVALKGIDVAVKKHTRAESCSSVAFRATVKARLGAGSDAVADASLRAAASLEARASAAAVDAVLSAGAVASAEAMAAANAAATLRAQLSASVNAAASAAAYASWRASLTGSGSVNGSVLGNYLSVNIATATTVQLAVSATATAAATLDAALDAAVKVAIVGSGAIDFNALAQSIVSAYSTYQAAVDLQATALAAFGAKAQPAVDVMATANASFRLP